MRLALFPAVIVVVASLGCTTSVEMYGVGFGNPKESDIIFFDSIRRANDRASLLATLDRATPLGTPISQAERLMSEAGFQCQYCTNSPFRECGEGPESSLRFVEQANYLLCSVPEGNDTAQKQNWTVAILYDDERNICDVLVSDESHRRRSKTE